MATFPGVYTDIIWETQSTTWTSTGTNWNSTGAWQSVPVTYVEPPTRRERDRMALALVRPWHLLELDELHSVQTMARRIPIVRRSMESRGRTGWIRRGTARPLKSRR